MTTRSRSVILSGYLITSAPPGENEEAAFEFTGDGGNQAAVMDARGQPVFCSLPSVKVFVSGIRWSKTWWKAEQGEYGTIVVLQNNRTFPNRAACFIDYRPLGN